MHFSSYYQAFVAILSFITLIGTANAYAPPDKVDLKSCKPYAVVAGAAVTNAGATVISGDLALAPGNLVTGFPAGKIIGTMRITGNLAQTCKGDLTTAMIDANGRSPNQQMTGQLGGMTLAPGVYKSSSGYAITGTLYLDGEDHPDAAWIFIMASTLVVNTGAQVVMQNYDLSKGVHVWWSCGSSASIFVHAKIYGTIMAYASISAMAKASTGPLMARLGQVTLLNNAVQSYEFGLYDSPTSQPSTQPTSMPSRPTAVPTAVPTAPTVVPTASPTKRGGHETVNMEVEQKVTGASAEQYNSDKAANDLTVQHALAENVDGVVPEDVVDLTATESESSISPNPHRVIMSATATNALAVPSFVLSFKMISRDPQVTFEKMAKQLVKAANSGKLLASLRKFALVYGADQIMSANLAVPLVHDATPHSESSDAANTKLTDGGIAGIVIGCVVGVALLGFLVFLILHTSAAKHAPEAVPTTEVAASV